MKRTAANIRGWYLGAEMGEGGSRRIGEVTYHFPPYKYTWQLSEGGEIYRDREL